jgi:hypothetical protein
MSQPAVSNALRRLRDARHDELLVRAGYGVEPTPRALELWPRCAWRSTSCAPRCSRARLDAAGSRDAFVLAMADSTAAW